MSNITFSNDSKVYNGLKQGLLINGDLPNGVGVSYSEGITIVGFLVWYFVFKKKDENVSVDNKENIIEEVDNIE